MTDAKIRELLREKDNKLEQLMIEYDRRFEDLPTNEFGEILVTAVLDHNAWYEREKSRIYNEFYKAILKK